jgi:DMSO reductase iron-sulfur subunit
MALAQISKVELHPSTDGSPLVGRPKIPLAQGEQYRFHFDMTKCIGCKCCEVACHEQNNTPVDVIWRRVGEFETQGPTGPSRLHVSMACNHCLEPSCLIGCPVDAYEKDERTGIVRLKDDACIGCQYCTWNCPYGAPQYNPERSQVTKCDLCYSRLEEGNSPACVSACPSDALQFEKVNVAEWRQDYHLANAPGVPEASITISTTRFTLPEDISQNTLIQDTRLEPEKPHYSLILLTVLTQLSVGGFFSLVMVDLISAFIALPPFFYKFLQVGGLAMLGTALLALLASVFHLGRPIYAYRALKMWRRSWLSREVLFFGLFAVFASVFSLWIWSGVPMQATMKVALSLLILICGWAGVYSSARIYMVPARPSWNTPRTLVNFFATGFLLGPLMALTVYAWNAKLLSIPLPFSESGTLRVGKFLVILILVAGFFQLLGILVKLFFTVYQESPELNRSARLLVDRFRWPFLYRLASLVAILAILPFALLDLAAAPSTGGGAAVPWITLAMFLALSSEMIGRYLFFVTVVPKNRPDVYLI